NTAKEIMDSTKGQVLAIACDVRKTEDIETVLVKGVESFGKIDALVNNAAGNFISPTEKLSANAFSAVIDIVLKGTVNATLAFGKYWIENKIDRKSTRLNSSHVK